MSTITIRIEGLDQMVRQLRRYPDIARPQYAKAINATLGAVRQQAIDQNFQFKTPRALRTGNLEASFSRGKKLATASNLTGSIGPRVNYAAYVYFGTGMTRPNPYMDRIAKAAEPEAQKYFKTSLDFVVEALAKGGA